MAGGQINFKVGYTVDKTGLQAVKASIQEIMNMKPTGATEFDNQLKIAQQDAQALSNILNQSFNKDLGTINVQKFNNALKASGTDLNKIQASMTAVGQGNAFRSMAAQVLTTNMQLKQTHTLLDSIATTMANTVKWGIASSVMNTFSGKVKEAYGYVKSLDTSLNNIRIVTEKSTDDMERFARTANKAAKELAATTKEYTDAALIYYQQGDTDAVAQAKAEVTLKTANVTQQSADEVSEQLTAVWNGYKVSAQEAESYVDKLAAVAATTASDLEELSTGMSKVASAANSMGVDIDQLNAQLATIVSVTRQAPESVGTALKTIYARMGDLAVDGEDEFGVSLGEVSGKMEQMGIKILDQEGNLRDMGVVIEETAKKWDTWTEAQKQAAAVAMAGKRQYNNLIALFENWDMYTDALNTSQNALETLDKQNEIYMESIEGHLNQLRTATEGFYDSLMDADGLNPMIDSLTDFMTLLDNVTQSLGGLGPILLILGATATKVFSKHIAKGISTTIGNMRVAKENAESLAATMELTNRFGTTGNQDKRLKTIIDMKKEILQLGESVTNEEHELVNQLILQTEEIYKQQDALKQRKENLNLGLQQYAGVDKDVSQMTQGEKDTAKIILEENKASIQEDSKKLDEIIAIGQIEDEISANKAQQVALEQENMALNEAEYSTEEELNQIIEQQKANEEKIKQLKEEELALSQKKGNASPQGAIKLTRELINTYELGDEALEKFDLALDNYGKDLERVNNGTKTHEDANRRLASTLKSILADSVKDIDKLLKELGFDFDNAEREANEMAVGAEAAMEKLKNSLSQRNAIQDFTTVIGLVGQLSMAISSIVRLPSIINDEDLTTGEKATQVISGLSMALLMLLPIMKKNNIEAMAGVAAFILKTTTLKASKTAATLAALADGQLTVAEIAAAGGATTLAGAIWSIIWPIGLVIAAVALLVAAFKGVQWIFQQVQAASPEGQFKAATQAAEEAAEAAKLATEQYQKLVDTFNQYDTAVEKLKELDSGTREYTEALREANEAAMELIKNNPELARGATRNSEGLIEFRDKNGEIMSSEEILKKEEAKKNSAQAAANMAQVYANQKEIDKDESNLIEDKFQTYDYMLDAYVNMLSPDMLAEVIAKINENGGSLLAEDLKELDIDPNGELGQQLQTNSKELLNLADKTAQLNATNQLLITDSMKNSLMQNEKFANLENAEQEAVAKIYGEGYTKEEQDKVRKAAEDEWYQDGIMGNGNEDKVHDAYAEAMGWTLSADKTGDKAVYVDAEGTEHTVEDDTARAYLVNQQVQAKMAKYNEENLDNITEAVTAISDASKGLGELNSSELLGFATGDKSFGSDFDIASYFSLKEAIDSGQLKNDLSKVTAEQWESLGYSSADEYMEALEKGLEKVDIEAATTAANTSIAKAQKEANNLYTKIISGDVTSENIKNDEDYKAVQNELEKIKGTYPEVEAAANVLNKTWLVGTQEYIEALELVQEAIDKAKMSGLADKAETEAQGVKDIWEKALSDNDELLAEKSNKPINYKVLVEANTEEFQNKMEKLMDAQYAIDVEIHTEASNEFNELTSALDNINENASLIGDNFIVSADKLQELNNVFPGILQNMQDVGNGSVKLDKTIAQSAMQAAQSEIAADAQSTIEKLQNQATLLRKRQKVYQSMADAALIMAKGEEATEQELADAKLAIDAGLKQAESFNDEQATQTKLDNNQTTADSANENAEIVAKNWSSAYESAAQSSYQFAKVAQQNMKAAAGIGPAKQVSTGDFGVNYSGTGGQSSEAKTISKTQELLDTKEGAEERWAEVAQQWQMLADSAGASANDIDGMIAETGARLNASRETLNGIKSGKGSDGKAIEYLEDEKDLYHDINIEIQQLENSMEELQSQQDKLYGQDLLNNLQKQLDLLEKQEDAQRRKLEIAKQEAATLKSTLAGQGTAFNADGTIANYQSLYNQKLAYVNSVIASGDEDAADAAQKAFEAWVENVERYDELISSEIPEIDQTIRDMMDERIEKQIEAFEYEITLKLDMKDAKRDWNDFKKNMTIDEDDILGSARFSFNNLGTYLSNDGTIATLTDQSNTLLDQLAQMNATGTSSIYGDNRAALMEDIAENQDALMAAMEEQKDLLDEIEQAYFDMLDAAQEAFDEQVAQYEAINEVYSHGLNVINVLYGEDAYAEMEGFYQSIIENTNDLISFQAKQVQMWKEKLNDPSLTDEQRDEIQKKMQEAQAAVLSSVETQLDNIINKYTNAINKIFKELEDKMTGGKGLSYIQEEWDLLNKNADMYLDQVNSAYEVEKLAREYNKAIDATDSLSAQRKLNELMEEQLKGLREKEKLTQYDVDRANALLDIELKRIALEEAQQNKSKMRLRRDASGNYSYQFVSDEDATAQAQQELADAQNSLYNLDKDAYKENLDAIVQLEQEFTEKYAEVMLDTTLTEEERQAKRLLLEEQYNEMMNNLLAQNTALRINLEDTALQEMSNLNQSYLMEDLIPGWNSGVQEMASYMTGEGGLLPTCADSFAELSGVTQQYITDLDTLEAVAGVDLSNVAGYTDAIVNSMTPVLENNDELIDKYNEEIRLMGELQIEAQTLAQTYDAITTAAMAAVDAMLAARQTEADINAEKAAQEAAAQQQAANEAAAAAQQQAAQQPSLAVGTGVTVKTTATHFSRDGGNGIRMKSFVPGSSYAVMQVSGNEVLIGRGGVATGWVNKTDLVGFRTGGYTGDWADAKGRLAVLHQKELVLNSKDTQNILRAVDVVRQIDGIMSSIMGNAFNKINNQINGLNSMSFPVGGPTSSEAAVAQHIEINADFPGVEKASEIISAFENLTNMATQYAFKTDR